MDATFHMVNYADEINKKMESLSFMVMYIVCSEFVKKKQRYAFSFSPGATT